MLREAAQGWIESPRSAEKASPRDSRSLRVSSGLAVPRLSHFGIFDPLAQPCASDWPALKRRPGSFQNATERQTEVGEKMSGPWSHHRTTNGPGRSCDRSKCEEIMQDLDEEPARDHHISSRLHYQGLDISFAGSRFCFGEEL